MDNKRIFVLGGKGFVGSAFVRVSRKKGYATAVVDLDTYDEFKGHECGLLVNAAGNSRKYLAETDPGEDFRLSVESVLRALRDFRCERYVHLSSVDVYPDHESPEGTKEEAALDLARQSPYGFHKYLGELLARKYAPSWLIIRLGGLLGPGLKKNPVFDLLNDIPLRVSEESRYQYLLTDFAAEAVLGLTERSIWGETLNLCGTGTVGLREVREFLGKPLRYFSDGVTTEVYGISNEKVSRFVKVPESRQVTLDFVRAWSKKQTVSPG